MRIAFIADPASPNAWYRCVGPMIAVAGRGGHELRQILKVDGSFHPELLEGCDVVHVHRQHDERTMKVLRHAEEAGMGIVWDNDDDMTAVPKGNPAYKTYGGLKGERVRAAVAKIMEMAGVVSTPSARLASLYREIGASDVRVIENYVRDEVVDVRRRSSGDGRLVIGWLAGVEHHLDVERLPIRETVQRLLEVHEQVEFTTIGVGLGLKHERYRHVPRVDFVDLLDAMADWDVGVAPIADIPFNRARSNIKVKEYAVLGMPWLASPVGAYVALGEKQGGRLVSDDGWYEALERIVLKERERKKLAKRALKWGKGQTVGANVALWEDVLRTAAERAKG